MKWRDHLGGPSISTGVFLRGRQEGQSQRRRPDDRAGVAMIQGRGHKTSNVGSFEARKGRKRLLL